MIGFSGPIAAGKTTAARYLETFGYRYIRYSMVLEALMLEEGRKVTRTALQKYGNDVHKVLGQRWLGRKLIEFLQVAEGNVVIDGLRFPDDHSFLVESFGPGFCHIHLEAPENIRRYRFNSREVGGVPFNKAQAHPVEQQVKLLRPLANIVMTNKSGIKQLQTHLVQFIKLESKRQKCQ